MICTLPPIEPIEAGPVANISFTKQLKVDQKEKTCAQLF